MALQHSAQGGTPMDESGVRDVQSGPSKPIITPQIDEWDYKLFALPNGLEVLLISDEKADMAAAAMDVQAGSMQDPDDLPGLAHFTEHMLFYASGKYPDESAYNKWIEDHGGHTNAWTAAEHTNYQFTVNWDHLETSLDRFAQFFIEPLISKDGIERERQAVDSEHSKNLQSDQWRQQQLWHTLAAPGHPFARFFTGNLATLATIPESKGVDVHARLWDFYNSEYSANRMKLCVLGRESVGELEAMVERLFTAVPNKQLPPREAPATGPYPPECRGKLVKTVPVNEGHSIRIKWMTPALEPLWKESPDCFLSHLIGHEGKGSLFAELKAKGWARSLSAGGGRLLQGNLHVEEVLTHIFQYINLLASPSGVSQELFDDAAALSKLGFNFREHPHAFSYTSGLANLMHDYPPEALLLIKHHVMQKFDEASIRSVLECLSAEEAIVMWVSHDHSAKDMETEPWYDQPYSVDPIPAEWVKAWTSASAHPALAMPIINPFTPKNLSMLPESSAPADGEPVKVVQDDMIAFYHKPHVAFGAPKGNLRMRFVLPQSVKSAFAATATSVFCALAADALNEVAYEAEIAGLQWSIEPVPHSIAPGLAVRVSGYSDTMRTLLREVLGAINKLEIKKDRFDITKERYVRSLRNWKTKQPYQWSSRLREEAMHVGVYPIDATKRALNRLTPESLAWFVDNMLFESARVEGLLLGNVDTQTAEGMIEDLRGTLKIRGSAPVDAAEMDHYRLVAIPRGEPVGVHMDGPNKDEQNSAHITVFQMHEQGSARVAALTDLTDQLMHREAFKQLRTIEQIGYIVTTFVNTASSVPHLIMLLQSTTKGAEEMGDRIDAFLAQWRRYLEEMPADEFAAQVEELAKNKLQRPKKLATLASRWLPEILLGRFEWNRHAEEVSELRQLTHAEVLKFVDSTIMSGTSGRRLRVNVRGAAEMARESAGAKNDEGTCENASPGLDAASDGRAANGDTSTNGVQEQPVCDAKRAKLSIEADQLSQFRLSQPLWPLPRHVW